MDMGQYLEMFIDESEEHIQTLNDSVLVLEHAPNDVQTINEMFRAAHSLKGISGSLGFTRLQRLTHDMENIFSEVRDGKLSISTELVDVLFKCLDAIEKYIENITNTGSEGENDNNDIINQLNSFLDNKKAAAAEEKKQEENKPDALIERKLELSDYEIDAIKEAEDDGMKAFEISVYIDKTCLLKSVRAFMVFKGLEGKAEIIKINPSVQDIEDEKFEFDFHMIVISEKEEEDIFKIISSVSEIEKVDIKKITADDYMVINKPAKETEKEETLVEKEKTKEIIKPAAKEKNETVKKTVVNHSVRVDIDKLDNLMNLVSELIIAKNAIISTGCEMASSSKNNDLGRAYKQQMEYLERITSNIHESVMRVRMVPIESVLNRFPRMIRDIAKKLNKEIELVITGEETELDRTVIDEIGDPLMHMLRNSADHGIEMPEEREKAGKDKKGIIHIDASQQGDNVIIKVSDDGAGIDVSKVRKKAVESGKITSEEAIFMSDEDVIALLFQPAFSTSEKVSDISGRGVGLDVVKSKIEGLGGDVVVETKLGEGSTFIVRLPLTLAVIKALMVYINKEVYAIPLSSVSIVEEIKVKDINYIQDRPFVNLRDEVVPLVFMNEYFRYSAAVDLQEDEKLVAVIVRKGTKVCGIVVDKYIGQQEIVIKPIGSFINAPKVISGSTILGNGNVALILDVNSII